MNIISKDTVIIGLAMTTLFAMYENRKLIKELSRHGERGAPKAKVPTPERARRFPERVQAERKISLDEEECELDEDDIARLKEEALKRVQKNEKDVTQKNERVRRVETKQEEPRDEYGDRVLFPNQKAKGRVLE